MHFIFQNFEILIFKILLNFYFLYLMWPVKFKTFFVVYNVAYYIARQHAKNWRWVFFINIFIFFLLSRWGGGAKRPPVRFLA